MNNINWDKAEQSWLDPDNSPYEDDEDLIEVDGMLYTQKELDEINKADMEEE